MSSLSSFNKFPQWVLCSLKPQVPRDNNEDSVLKFSRLQREPGNSWALGNVLIHANLWQSVGQDCWGAVGKSFWSPSRSFWRKGQANQHFHKENKILQMELLCKSLEKLIMAKYRKLLSALHKEGNHLGGHKQQRLTATQVKPKWLKKTCLSSWWKHTHTMWTWRQDFWVLATGIQWHCRWPSLSENIGVSWKATHSGWTLGWLLGMACMILDY